MRFRPTLLLLMCCLLLAGCNNTKTINGVKYDVYGVLNQNEKMNPNIEYNVSPGSVVMAVIFSETIVVPLYVIFLDLWEPVGPKTAIKGQIQ